VEGLLLLLIAPLVAAWGWVLWLIVREREARLVVPLLLLPTLAARHLVSPPPASTDFVQLLVDGNMPLITMDAAINLLAAAVTVVVCSSLRERNRAEEMQWHTMETLCQLANFFATCEGSFERRLRDLLDLGCAQLGMEIGVLAASRDAECEIVGLCAPPESGIARGDRLELDATFCRETLGFRGAFCIEDASEVAWATHLAREMHQFESYIGIAIRLQSERYGTLFFASRKPRSKRFSAAEKTRLELMAHWTTSALEVQRSARERVEFTRLQNAALDLSQASFEGGKEVDYVKTGLERIAKTLDLEAAALLAYQADERQLQEVAASGGGSSAFRENTSELAEKLGPHLQSRDVEVVGFAADGELKTPEEECTLICVPITSLGNVAGCLTVYPHQARRLSSEELDYLRIGASLMSDALGGLSERDANRDVGGEASGARVSRQLVPRRSESVERRRLDLHWAIERLADELHRSPHAPIELELALAEEVVEAPIYRYEFDRLLLSLIHHARQANPESTIRVDTRRAVAPRNSCDEAYAVVTVSAPGVILSAQDLADLFAPTPPGALEQRKLEIGQLPLHRVERLLQDAQGDLSVLSEPDRGTVFTAYLRTGTSV